MEMVEGKRDKSFLDGVNAHPDMLANLISETLMPRLLDDVIAKAVEVYYFVDRNEMAYVNADPTFPPDASKEIKGTIAEKKW